MILCKIWQLLASTMMISGINEILVRSVFLYFMSSIPFFCFFIFFVSFSPWRVLHFCFRNLRDFTEYLNILDVIDHCRVNNLVISYCYSQGIDIWGNRNINMDFCFFYLSKMHVGATYCKFSAVVFVLVLL